MEILCTRACTVYSLYHRSTWRGSEKCDHISALTSSVLDFSHFKHIHWLGSAWLKNMLSIILSILCICCYSLCLLLLSSLTLSECNNKKYLNTFPSTFALCVLHMAPKHWQAKQASGSGISWSAALRIIMNRLLHAFSLVLMSQVSLLVCYLAKILHMNNNQQSQ